MGFMSRLSSLLPSGVSPSSCFLTPLPEVERLLLMSLKVVGEVVMDGSEPKRCWGRRTDQDYLMEAGTLPESCSVVVPAERIV